MFDTQELTNVVKNHKGPSPSGVSCKFININDEYGIKVYGNKDERDYAFEKQNMVAASGYAPIALTSFDIDNKLFCYITEKVETVVDPFRFKENCHLESERVDNEKPNLKFEIRKLAEEINNKCDFYVWDSHYGNWGYLRGKLVYIDFGQ